MSITVVPGRYTTLPDEHALRASVVALEEHGFSVEVLDNLDAARQAVLARIPEGSSVMTNTSVTLARPASRTRSTTAAAGGSRRGTRCSRSTSPARRRK